ncbi:MAG: LysM peptidoglycan-binding domain-containing protein, partial [Gammaproteobacteria bacterium]|nr:LysM peptidoglycan-binding domain-containing protein [Gammaproteobacteria bacterium]
IPGTGRRFALKQNWWYDGRRDVIQSTRAALDYLEYLHKKFKGDWLLALAAYNSGEGTVSKAIRKNRRRGKAIDFWSLKLPKETRGYVPKLLAISNVIANPEANSVVINQVANEPFLTTIDTEAQIDLDLAAELADVSLEDIYLYNPGFNRWATDPKGPHKLLVPVAKAESFKQRLVEYPLNERIKWARHKIKSGDNFGSIANRYRTTIGLLKKVNGIRGNTIRAGKMLTIPVARKKLSRYRLSAEQRQRAIQHRPRKGNKLEHVVQPSDTFWDLAQKYGVKDSQLAKWNGMAPRDPLFPGQKLIIWSKKPAQTSAINPARFKHPHLSDLNRRIAYTVRRGDSLASISQRFRVRLKDLLRWNKKVKSNNYLQPGQRLTLYVDVVRQSGSSSI